MGKEESFADLLTIIHWSAYNEIKWEIYASEEYESWFETLALDSKRKAFLLTGGDKKGKDENRFYKNLITQAEKIIEKHEKEINR